MGLFDNLLKGIKRGVKQALEKSVITEQKIVDTDVPEAAEGITQQTTILNDAANQYSVARAGTVPVITWPTELSSFPPYTGDGEVISLQKEDTDYLDYLLQLENATQAGFDRYGQALLTDGFEKVHATLYRKTVGEYKLFVGGDDVFVDEYLNINFTRQRN